MSERRPAAPSHPAAEERYTVLGELARGGFGQVLEATDEALGRQVAIKQLLGWKRRGAGPLRARGQADRPLAARGRRPGLRPRALARRRALLRDEEGRRPLAGRADRAGPLGRGAAGAAAAGARRRRGHGLRAQPRRHPPRPQALQRGGERLRRDGGHRLGAGQGAAPVASSADEDLPDQASDPAPDRLGHACSARSAFMPPEQAAGAADRRTRRRLCPGGDALQRAGRRAHRSPASPAAADGHGPPVATHPPAPARARMYPTIWPPSSERRWPGPLPSATPTPAISPRTCAATSTDSWCAPTTTRRPRSWAAGCAATGRR